MATSKLYYTNPLININWFGATPNVILPSGPLVSTTLTKGVPGKNFTRKRKEELIFGIFQEGLLAKNTLAKMTELERAEYDLASAEEAHASAYDPRDTEPVVNDARQKVGRLRAEKAKKEAMDAARAHWRNLVDKAKRH